MKEISPTSSPHPTSSSSSEAPLIAPGATVVSMQAADGKAATATTTSMTPTTAVSTSSEDDVEHSSTAATLKIRQRDADETNSRSSSRSCWCPATSIALAVLLAGFAAALLILGVLYSLDLRFPDRAPAGERFSRQQFLSCEEANRASSAAVGVSAGSQDPCAGDFYAAACAGYASSHPLRWRSGGRLESMRTSLADTQEAIEDALVERLYHGAKAMGAVDETRQRVEPTTEPVWLAAVTNLTRTCTAAAADFPRDALLNLLTEQPEADAERRLPPMSFFGRRSLASGGVGRWGSIGRLVAHGFAFGVDLTTPNADAAAIVKEGDALSWLLEPRKPKVVGDETAVAGLVKATFERILGRGVPQIIAKAVGRYHENLTRTLTDAAVSGDVQVLTMEGVADLFPSGVDSWIAFRSAAFPDWADGRYQRMFVRSPDTLRRVLRLMAELDPDSLAAYAFVNAVAGLERFAVGLGEFFNESPIKLMLRHRRQLPLGPATAFETTGRRCLRVAFDLMPSPSAFALLEASPGENRRLRRRQLVTNLRSRLADVIRAADIDLETKRELLSALDGERYGYAFGDTDEIAELRMANTYGGLRVSREAGYLAGVLDTIRHRRRSGYRLAFIRSGGNSDADNERDLGAAPALLEELASPGLWFPLAVNALALPSTSLALLTAHDLLSRVSSKSPTPPPSQSWLLRCGFAGDKNRSSSFAPSEASSRAAVANRQLWSVSLALAAVRPASPVGDEPEAKTLKDFERSFLLSSAQLLGCHRAAPDANIVDEIADQVGLSSADRARLLTIVPEFPGAFGCQEAAAAARRNCQLIVP